MTTCVLMATMTLSALVPQDDGAKDLLLRAAAACKDVETASWEAVHTLDVYDRDGELRPKTSRARVVFERNAGDELFPARMRIEYPMDDRWVIYREGVETFVSTKHRRAVINRRGSVGLVSGGIYYADMHLADLTPGAWNPTSRPTLERIAATASMLRLEDSEEVAGRTCHVVRYEQPQDWRERRYEGLVYVDETTLLPRKHVHLAITPDGTKGGSTFVIEELVTGLEVEDGTFEPEVGEDYEVHEFDRDPPARTEFLAVGATVPDFSLKDPAGDTHRLADQRGKVVVLDFWGTWCAPCVAAMPHVQALHERFVERDVVVWGLSCREKEGADPAGLMREKGFTYGLLLEADAVAGDYGIPAYPTILVISPDGVLLHRKVGLSEESLGEIGELIEEALKKRAPR